MDFKNIDFELTSELFNSDQDTYDRTFFSKLQEIKSELYLVEHLKGPYSEASPVEIDQAERFYFQLIDDLNELDMSIRKENLDL